MTYPTVLSERETLAAVVDGASLARYGDGEFALAEGRSIVNQPRSPELCARLRGILKGEARTCLVGIPNIRAVLPPLKVKFWTKYTRCAALLTEPQAYVSSFVTRPDNAPWIDTPAYWAQLETLWAGKDVKLVRGCAPEPNPKRPGRLTGAVSLVAADLTTARSVIEIVAPSVNAWREYARLLDEIGTPKTAILCLGATATVLAVDLCARGVHAIDLGHVGLFLRKHRRGEPMDKAA